MRFPDVTPGGGGGAADPATPVGKADDALALAHGDDLTVESVLQSLSPTSVKSVISRAAADAVAEVVHARQEGGLLILRLARERRQTTRRRVREGVQVLLGGLELVQEGHRRREDVPSGGRRGRRVEGHDRGEVRVEVEGVILKRDADDSRDSVSAGCPPSSRDDDFE